jgi:chromosome partitioning protein
MIIAVCGQKGGTGKTTTAYSIAAEMVSRGRKVLVVDADPQGSARTWVARALAEKHPAPTVIAMYETMYQPGQLEQFQGQFAVVVIDCPPGHAESERPVAIQRAALAVADLAILPGGRPHHEEEAAYEHRRRGARGVGECRSGGSQRGAP